MPNRTYDNFYLSNEIEDQFKSHLNLQQFCTVDNTLSGTPGMVRKIHVYKATDGTEKLGLGEGNTKAIEVGFASREYRIQLAQNRFQYYDEEAMTDPNIVPVGTQHMATDLFNVVNADIYDEFNKATLTVKTDAFDFAAFTDAVALLNIESTDNDPAQTAPMTFAFISPKDMADLRKSLKEDLKYVEAYARTGYVGTVAGVNVYTKKDAIPGTVIVATSAAVTIFNKPGIEAGQERDENIRRNTIYSRKYYFVAMTDETKAVKIIKNGSEADAQIDPKKISLPTKGDNLYGKSVSDLIGADVKVTADGKVTGTIKKVDGYTEFSSVKEEQSGHFFPIYINAAGTKAEITGSNDSKKSWNLADDRQLVLRVDKYKTGSKKAKISIDGEELVSLDFTEATLV